MSEPKLYLTFHYSVDWSKEDQQYVGLCRELPSMSHLADTQREALRGIMELIADVVCADEGLLGLTPPGNGRASQVQAGEETD